VHDEGRTNKGDENDMKHNFYTFGFGMKNPNSVHTATMLPEDAKSDLGKHILDDFKEGGMRGNARGNIPTSSGEMIAAMGAMIDEQAEFAWRTWRAIFDKFNASPATHKIIAPMSLKKNLPAPPEDYRSSVYFSHLVEGQLYCMKNIPAYQFSPEGYRKSIPMPDMMANT